MILDPRIPLLAIGALGLAAVARIIGAPLVPVELHSSDGIPPAATPKDSARPLMARDAVTAIVDRDPFRIGRLPAITAYDPIRLAQPTAPPAPRPQLMLVGIIDGAEPSAVVEGFPGLEGARVVRVGEVVDGLRVKAISGGRVTIVGMDTTWVLEIKEPWKD